MKITRIQLKNVGLHRDIDWKTDAGVIGITGANGEGKTTILSALEFIFVGKLLEMSTKKEELLTHGETKGHVAMWFEQGGKAGYLKRDLEKSSRILEWDGAEYTSDADVTRVMTQILNTSLESFRASSFIRQGELKNALFGTDAHRRDIMIRLLDVGHVAPVHSALERAIKKYRTQNIDETVYGKRDTLLENLEHYKAEIERLKKRADEVGFNEAEYDKFVDYRNAISELEDVKKEIEGLAAKLSEFPDNLEKGVKELNENLERLEGEILIVDGKIKTLRTTLQNVERVEVLSDEKAQLQTSLKDVETETKKIQAHIDELCSLLGIQSPEEHNVVEDNLKHASLAFDLKVKLEEAKAALKSAEVEAKHQRVAALAETKDLSEFATTITQNALRVNVLQSGLDVLTKVNDCTGDKVTCPKCNLKVLPKEMLTPEQIDAMKAEIDEAKEAIKKAQEAQEEASTKNDTLKRAADVAQANLTRAETNLDNLQTQYNVFVVKGITPLSKEDSVYKERASALQQLKSVLPSFTSLITKEQQYTTSLNQTLEKLEDLQKGLDSVDLDKTRKELQTLEQQRDEFVATRSECLQKKKELQPKYEAWQSTTQLSVHLNTVKLPELESRVVELKPTGRILRLLEITGGKDLETIYRGLIEQRREYENVCGEVRAAEREKLRIETDLTSVQKLVDRQKGLQRVLQRMEELTRVTCAEGAVKHYILHAFRALYPHVSKFLSLLDANFTIKPSADALSFDTLRIDKENSGWLDMKTLSGGQKVKLALSFLLALQETLARANNFLVLDEPSVHLDTQAVDALTGLITKLTTLMTNSGGQCWMVDHHEVLQGAFAKNFKLGQNNSDSTE